MDQKSRWFQCFESNGHRVTEEICAARIERGFCKHVDVTRGTGDKKVRYSRCERNRRKSATVRSENAIDEMVANGTYIRGEGYGEDE